VPSPLGCVLPIKKIVIDAIQLIGFDFVIIESNLSKTKLSIVSFSAHRSNCPKMASAFELIPGSNRYTLYDAFIVSIAMKRAYEKKLAAPVTSMATLEDSEWELCTDTMSHLSTQDCRCIWSYLQTGVWITDEIAKDNGKTADSAVS
jgi:hypothetical protein